MREVGERGDCGDESGIVKCECPRGLESWGEAGCERCWQRGKDWVCGVRVINPAAPDDRTVAHVPRLSGERGER